MNSAEQHADLIPSSVTALGCTSKHFKWEEAPAHRYCPSSPISQSLGADSAPAKPSRQWEPTGREQTSLPWAGAAGAPRGAAGHGGERGAARGHRRKGRVPGAHPSPRRGMQGSQQPARWVWASHALPGAVLGMGRLMNLESILMLWNYRCPATRWVCVSWCLMRLLSHGVCVFAQFLIEELGKGVLGIDTTCSKFTRFKGEKAGLNTRVLKAKISLICPRQVRK